METKIKIKSNSGTDYVIEVLESTLEREIKDGVTRWSFRYSLKGKNDEEVSAGGMSVDCPLNHLHLEDEEVFTILLKLGAGNIKRDLDQRTYKSSMAYAMHASDCRK